MEKMENVYIMDHPLIKHKISMLRDKNWYHLPKSDM